MWGKPSFSKGNTYEQSNAINKPTRMLDFPGQVETDDQTVARA
jgi:hypothetical protein